MTGGTRAPQGKFPPALTALSLGKIAGGSSSPRSRLLEGLAESLRLPGGDDGSRVEEVFDPRRNNLGQTTTE
jgi:hypothetical protein